MLDRGWGCQARWEESVQSDFNAMGQTIPKTKLAVTSWRPAVHLAPAGV